MDFRNNTLQFSLRLPFFLPKLLQFVEKISNIFKRILLSIKSFLFSIIDKIRAVRERKKVFSESSVSDFQERKKRLNIKKFIKPVLIIFVLIGVFVFLVKALGREGQVSSDKIKVGVPEKTFNIGREFTFPVRDANGKKVTDIKYKVEKAELTDQIIVQGKKATAVKGRTFLIINLKISNEYTLPVEIQTRNYIRLSVNGNEEEWLAPDIHNDPVEVQAISTKNTRVGFPINETDNKLVLRVGEIEGDKEKIPLEF